MPTEARILADTHAYARMITRYFLSRIPDERFTDRPEAFGHRFNSAHWITAHLVWSDADLLLRRLDGPDPGIPWLDEYALGTDPDAATTPLSRADLKEAAKRVHAQALEHVAGLSDADLERDSGIPMFPTWRQTIQHAIRHEGNHGGHLGWLVKMLGGASTI